MSRRKQAKPRLWKREEEDEECLENFALNVIYESTSIEDLTKEEVNGLDDDESFSVISLHRSIEGAENNCDDENKSVYEENLGQYSHECLSENGELKDDEHGEHFLLDDDDSLDSDTLGTEGGSSWASEDQTTSPSSSCATPNSASNSASETPESEVTFTIGVTDGTPFLCKHCNKAFTRSSYCKKHEQTHDEEMQFNCVYCDRDFKHKRSRDRHLKLHTGDKKYLCTQCDAAFSRSDHLKIHMKTHDKQKPFQCTICNRGYNTAAALTSHMQNHKRSKESSSRRHAAGPTFKCLQCSEIFQKPEDLKSHMRTHKPPDGATGSNGRSKSLASPLMRLNCAMCTKENFPSIDALKAHQHSVHQSTMNGDLKPENATTKKNSSSPTSTPTSSDSPPYPNQSFSSLPSYCCEICAMRFFSVLQLRKHISSVHPEVNNLTNSDQHHSNRIPVLPNTSGADKLYCWLCPSTFQSSAALTDHYLIFHSYQNQMIGLAPPLPPPPGPLPLPAPEQVKPTDLSVTRKSSSLKRSDDQSSLPRKKTKLNEISNQYFSIDRCSSQLICNFHQCGELFSDFESFRKHVGKHIVQNGGIGGDSSPTEVRRPEFACPHCRSVFSSSEEISQHVLAHFLVNSVAYNCESCRRVFNKAEDMQKHLIDVHSRPLYSCSICNDIFDSKTKLQVHLASNHSGETKLYRCISCSHSEFHSELEFATHVKMMHMNISLFMNPFGTQQNSSAVKCPVCNTSFPTDTEMQIHLTYHGRQFQCRFCPQSFQVEYLLDKHVQSHHSPSTNGNADEPAVDLSPTHQSPISRAGSPGKKLENGDAKGSLLRCEICDKKEFVNEMDLLTHKRLLHNKVPSSPGRRSIESSESGEDLTKKNRNGSSTSPSPTQRYDNLKKLSASAFNGDHSNATNNNAISCEMNLCEKRDFSNETELPSKKPIHQSSNMKIASSKMNLLCAYCNENCKSRSELENHMKSHSQTSLTSGKHKCNICDEICPTAAVLAEHKLTHCKVVAGNTCMLCKSSIDSQEQFFLHVQQHSLVNSSGTKNIGTNTNNSGSKGNSSLVLPTVCIICRQTLVSEMEASMHARYHLQPVTDLVPCSGCLQMFKRQEVVAGLCHECYQRRGGKSSPVQCPECQIQFDNSLMLEIHFVSVHKKSFQCIRCQMSFDGEKEFQHHMGTHLMMDGLTGFTCRLCPAVFPTPMQLQAHMIEHAYADRFKCYFCSTVFTAAHELQAHIVTEHGQSPNAGQKYFYNHEDQTSDERTYKMKSSAGTYEQLVHFQDESDRFMINGDREQRHSFMEVDDEEKPGVQSVEVKLECRTQDDAESEDEQIDVVTTKTEDAAVEQSENADGKGFSA